MIPRPLLAVVAATFLIVPRVTAAEAVSISPQEVQNLSTFARAYGYVRFFYPSDAAANIDWDKVAIIGAEDVRHASDRDALRQAISRTLGAIAPQMSLSEAATPSAREATTERVTFWQYGGINLTDQRSVYQQRRVIVGASVAGRAPLFEPVERPRPITREIAPGLFLHMPTALAVTADGATTDATTEGLVQLQSRLADRSLTSASPTDWRVRVAGALVVWNVFQHFHPYLDLAGVRWDDVLAPALERALKANDEASYSTALSELVAMTGDGHGFVYGPGRPDAGLPARFAVIEGRVVVTGTTEDTPLRKGDVLTRIDGSPTLEMLAEVERRSPGSPHLSRFRALNALGGGPAGSAAHLEVERDGARLELEVARERQYAGYFFKSVPEFPRPPFEEIRAGIFYVNLSDVSADDYDAKLSALADARGIIFDQRFTGDPNVDRTSARLKPTTHIIPHLIDAPVYASPMLIPKITAPDRVGWSHQESTWPVKPKSPRFKGRVVIINVPSVVSYGETCMAIITHHRLATLVGTATAGCNGNANFLPLPGGYRVMWTGMEVVKHDRSPFYGVGFAPDVPVERTLKAVAEGSDEMLEAAIRFLNTES